MSADNVTANALGSATAGIISRVLTHPLDTVRKPMYIPQGCCWAIKHDSDRSNFRPFQSEGQG